MKTFTPDTFLWSIRHCKEFKSFKKYVICPRSFAVVMQVYKIKNLQWFYPLNPEVTANALNEMKNRVLSGQTLYTPLSKKDVGVYSFLVGQNKPFVLVLPGGGYGDVCSLVEGFSTAVRLNELGYNAFIGQYSVGKNAHYPNPCNDVAEILKFIFSNAEKMRVDTRDYAVCGFSAGGHLAASWGTKSLGYLKYSLPKPKTVMLSYPVITMGEKAGKLSRKYLLGKDGNDIQIQNEYSIEKLVDYDYPDVYVWQCENDKVVPILNSEMLAEALGKFNRTCEFFRVDGDKHGWGPGIGTPAEGWLDKAVSLWQRGQQP